jgi:hypothetical protein
MSSNRLPEPRLTQVYRLEATLGEPLDIGQVAQGHRRIVPQTGGRFTGPEISGKLLPGASADWQIVTPDGTTFADIRYTLQTDGGDLLYVQSRVCATVTPRSRNVRAQEDVDSSSTRSARQPRSKPQRQLDWLNKGVFIARPAPRA